MGFFDLLKKKFGTNGNEKKVEKAEDVVKKVIAEAAKSGPVDQDKLLAAVNAAQAQFKKDQNLNAVIEVLENAFWKVETPLKSSQCMDLIKYYLQAEKTDNAREYLNFLKEQNDRPAEEYRIAEAKILKSESNFSDAILQYMLGYLLKAERTGKLQEDKLQNDIRSSIKKQGWPESSMNELVGLLRKHVNKKDFKVESLEADVKKLIAKLA